jgi:hypothetical protein
MTNLVYYSFTMSPAQCGSRPRPRILPECVLEASPGRVSPEVVPANARSALGRDDDGLIYSSFRGGSEAQTSQRVVPAKAGTHNHRALRLHRLSLQRCPIDPPVAMGPGSAREGRLAGTTTDRFTGHSGAGANREALSESSPRRRGPITTGVCGLGWSSYTALKLRGLGVWVPAFAGRTRKGSVGTPAGEL